MRTIPLGDNVHIILIFFSLPWAGCFSVAWTVVSPQLVVHWTALGYVPFHHRLCPLIVSSPMSLDSTGTWVTCRGELFWSIACHLRGPLQFALEFLFLNVFLQCRRRPHRLTAFGASRHESILNRYY